MLWTTRESRLHKNNLYNYVCHLRDKGMCAEEIKNILEKEKLQASIYITVDTLKYLKKGGRITPAAAAIGTLY